MGILDKLLGKQTESKSYSAPALMVQQQGRTPKFNNWNTELAIAEGYKNSTWVYACVKLRSNAVSSVPWVAQRKVAQDQWQAEPNSDLQKLLDRPNPDMDRALFFKYIVQHLDLSGNSFISKVRAGQGNEPKELWPLMPTQIEVIAGDIRLIKEYIYKGAGRKSIPPEDMLQFLYPDPSNMYFGMSPLMSAGQAVDIDNEAERFQKSSLENRGLADIHFEVPPDATAEQVSRLREIFQEQQSGPRNARRALFSSAKATPLNVSAAELDFIESRKFVRDEICSAYGVPPPMVGNYEKATLANIETARQIFWRDTIVPLLDELETKLNLSLAVDFGPEWRIKYDISGITALQENFSEKVTNAQQLFSLGVPFNEINSKLKLGFEDMAGGDVGYLPSGLLPTDFQPTDLPIKSISNTDLGILAYGQKDLKATNIAPQGAQTEAKKGLAWREEFGRGGTMVGVARARDISNGANLSNETIGRMVSYFARHEVDKQATGFNAGEDGYPSNGRIAWALWGGDAGRTWAEKVWAQIQEEQ
jgi:HK97 family phage portal protein